MIAVLRARALVLALERAVVWVAVIVAVVVAAGGHEGKRGLNVHA